MESFSRHAFISYVREDSDEVDKLQETLEAAGIRVWRDTADLWPGEDWRFKIRHAITRNSLVFIACFSSQSVRRRESYQNEELLLAIEQLRLRRPYDPWLIPVRFDDCDIPDLELGGGRTLGSINRADLFGDKRDAAVNRLIAAILRTLSGWTTSLKATDSEELPPEQHIERDQGSKVLEINLDRGAYRMDWAAEGAGLFRVRCESGLNGESRYFITVVAPNPNSGERIVRITEGGSQRLRVEAERLTWELRFTSILPLEKVSPDIDIVNKSYGQEPDTPYVTPLVRMMANQYGIDLTYVPGTGVGGRIRRQDLLRYAGEADEL
jgi:TIR domain/e3 binding domain